MFSNISSSSSIYNETPSLSNTIERTGKVINGITMVKLNDLAICLGATISGSDPYWYLSRNGQTITFTRDSKSFGSTITYSIKNTESGSNESFTFSCSGTTDVAAQLIDNEKYVQLSFAAKQLGSLMIAFDSVNNKVQVFDFCVNGTTPLSDYNAYLVGGPWLNSWSNKGSVNLSQHFSTNEFWDHSTSGENPEFYTQIKISVEQIQCAENVRYYYNKDIDNNICSMILSCGFRSWWKNGDIGGAVRSNHMQGQAWDVPGAAETATAGVL